MKRIFLAALFLAACSSPPGPLSSQLAGIDAGPVPRDAGHDAAAEQEDASVDDASIDASIDVDRPPSTFCEFLPDGGQKCWQCPPSDVPIMCDAGTND